MFDNQNLTAAPQNQGANQPPAPTPGPISPPSGAVTPPDMFSETESPLPNVQPARPAVFQPKPETPAASGNVSDYQLPAATNFKKYLVLLGLLAAISALAGGGWYVYKKFAGTAAEPADTTAAATPPIATEPVKENPPIESAAQNTEPVAEIAASTSTATASDSQAAIGAKPKDSDDDGLSDEEEIKLGTNPNSPDSDNDGLFDYEEVRVYGTDPLKADTDGDGYTDGQEVKGGYNPLGWGKLFDPKNPKASSSKQ